jgi:hypothetical protein
LPLEENIVTEPIRNLSVSGFRAFTDLRVGPFGHVNLITGRNNAGKSSLLEAIRIFVTEGSARTFYDILSYREESDVRSASEVDRLFLPSDFSSICSLFSEFPNLAGCDRGFTISTRNGESSSSKSLSASVGWFVEKIGADGRSVNLERSQYESVGLLGDGFPALEVEFSDRKRIVRIDRQLPRLRSIAETGEVGAMPCVFLDPFSSRSTSQLAAFWDKIALTDLEKEVVGALKIISDDIEAVSMIGSNEGGPRPRTAIVRSRRYSSPIPLRTLGDGVNRLFGIILSLCCARGGVLLVDEIENGLHHSVLTDIWRAIFRLARDLQVQVFATSHSWDCIEAFQTAASESSEESVLVRLTRKSEKIIPTVFGKEKLRIATRDHIELR